MFIFKIRERCKIHVLPHDVTSKHTTTKKKQMQLPYLRINSSHARRRPNRKCVSIDALLKQHRVQINVGGIDTDLCVTQPNTPFST